MRRAEVFWFTGLSGAGKTTVAEATANQLRRDGVKTLILDGDEVRSRVNVHLGFTPKDIIENNRLICDFCMRERGNYDVILVPIISPYQSSRDAARDRIGEGFNLVRFSARLEVVAARDTKGLYAKAASGKIDNLIGMSQTNKYEPVKSADIEINTADETIDQSVENLLDYVRERIAIGVVIGQDE